MKEILELIPEGHEITFTPNGFNLNITVRNHIKSSTIMQSYPLNEDHSYNDKKMLELVKWMLEQVK